LFASLLGNQTACQDTVIGCAEIAGLPVMAGSCAVLALNYPVRTGNATENRWDDATDAVAGQRGMPTICRHMR